MVEDGADEGFCIELEVEESFVVDDGGDVFICLELNNSDGNRAGT